MSKRTRRVAWLVVWVACLASPGVAGAAQKVTAEPDIQSLPGGGTFQGLVNGVAAFAGSACLAGLLVGAALWALGAHAQNYQQSSIGKKTAVTSFLAALLVGGATGIINFFLAAGSSIK